MKYRFTGKEKLLSFGTHPEVSLADAHRQRHEARAKLREKVGPGAVWQARKLANVENGTFAAIALEYLTTRKDWKPTTALVRRKRLDANVFPWIGAKAVESVTAPELLAVLRRIEANGHHEMAHRMLQLCSQIFRFAVHTSRAERDPTYELRRALTPVKARHHSSVTEPRKVGELLRAIDGYQGSFPVQCALRLAPLVFVRPGELRHAVWEEFDTDRGEWRLPAERMKMDAPHLVPLAAQAIDILSELKPLTGPSGFVFLSIRTRSRPMSENTVNGALRRLGYSKEEATGHGFPSMASTLLNEQGWNREAIERQLAHAERDKMRAADNYADHLPERRRMMQSWANYLDGLKTGDEIVSLHPTG
jgi:integrase